MDSALRTAWTEVVTPDDYERHMAAIGQAQAAASLTRAILDAAPPPGGRVVIAGAGTGQMLEFLDPAVLRPFRLTFTDLNARFLDRLRGRIGRHSIAAEVLIDDIERSTIPPGPDLLMATLLFEHIEWRRGVEAFAALRPMACALVIQENPPGMATAVTPGRVLPPSLARAMQRSGARLVPSGELVNAFASYGYGVRMRRSEPVADGKRLTALLWMRS